MSSILTSFEELTRAYTKALPVITKEENGVTPRFIIRALVELEDFINEVWEDREGRKALSKNNSKSLGTLRQKVRKYIKDFEEQMVKFREAPDQEDDEEEEKSKNIFILILKMFNYLNSNIINYLSNQQNYRIRFKF